MSFSYFKSIGGKIEVEAACADDKVVLSLFPLHEDARNWNGAALSADTAKALAEAILAAVES